jgi:hypothetical protein
MDARADPGTVGREVSSAEIVQHRRIVAYRTFEQLRCESRAESVVGEIAEQPRGPVDVLQAADCVGGRAAAEQCMR